MNPIPTDPSTITSLPLWMQLAAFIASSVLILLTIFGLINQLVKKPTLEFRLTREMFFRITELEEAIFANGVLFAKNDGVLIDNVSFKLIKTDEPKKSFPLRVAHFGEKVRGFSPVSDFYFYTTSPISYIPVYYPQRIVYFLVQESYEKDIKEAFEHFKSKVKSEHQQFQSNAPSVEPVQKEKAIQDFAIKVNLIVKEQTGKIMEQIQLESGKYKLEAEIFYKIKKMFLSKSKRSCKSKISFEIEDNIKGRLRAQLISSLENISKNIIYAETNPIKYPEYSPIEIKEL